MYVVVFHRGPDLEPVLLSGSRPLRTISEALDVLEVTPMPKLPNVAVYQLTRIRPFVGPQHGDNIERSEQ